MELHIPELASMLIEFVVFFAMGYLCWKHKADLTDLEALLAVISPVSMQN
jgi:hypothetical protein